MRSNTNRQVRKLGALMTLVGFALGVAFGVVAVLSIIDGDDIIQILGSLLPVIGLGLLFSIVGLALRGYQREEANHAPLLEIPDEEEELDLVHFQRRPQKIKIQREEEEL